MRPEWAAGESQVPIPEMKEARLTNGRIRVPPLLAKVDGAGPPLKVLRRTRPNGKAEIALANGTEMALHPFALAGKVDTILQGPDETIFVRLPKGRGAVPVSPAWRMRRDISVFGRKMAVVVKEIEGEKEFAGYDALLRHHYRSGAGATRRAPLIAKVKAPDLPEVVGFVELTSCFLVNVARKKILDAPFSDGERGVRWKRWDMDAAKKYTNVMARISRCVVYPELRGIGIAGILAEAAKRFAMERWHIGGFRPSFLEITAEMLRYWPFVEKAGFVKVGDTQGNGDRLEKSMTYLLNRQRDKLGFPGGGGGIMTMYRAHASMLGEVMEKRGMNIEEIVELVKKSPERLGVKDWMTLHGIYRRPKPVYMLGLTDAAEAHLRARLRETSSADSPEAKIQGSPSAGILVRGMSVCASCKPESSKESRRIQEAFGIVAKRSETKIAAGLNLEAAPGEIVLVSGASGSGKSLLLRALAWHASGKQKKWKLPRGIDARAGAVAPVKVAMMSHPDPRKSPIALLEKFGLNLEDAMRLLSSAGLGEAQLFVRPSGTLSTGQRYRLSLALAFARKPDLLLIDEFCESLDDYSAAAVCRRLRKEAVRSGIAVFAATVNGARIAPELRPDRVLRLLPNRRHQLENWKP